jgi:hypothetical protein
MTFPHENHQNLAALQGSMQNVGWRCCRAVYASFRSMVSVTPYAVGLRRLEMIEGELHELMQVSAAIVLNGVGELVY